MKVRSDERENRVLILMPTGRDAELVRSTLSTVGVSSESYHRFDDILASIPAGGGAVLIAEEAIDTYSLDQLVRTLEAQPVWSDLPVLVFSSHGRNAERLLDELGGRINVTIVERPIRITMLVSAVRGALRARERQYQTRDLLTQLEQADEQKDIFLATLSHELRTPLNSILGWIQIMRGRELDEAATKHALEVIERNAHGQSEMISDILFVSRIITGKLEIKHEPVDINGVVGGVVDMIKPSTDSKSIALEIDTTGYEPAPIEGDAERLKQVLLNLLTNAAKFTPDGGTITVRLRRVGSEVSVSVEDNGQGINPQFIPHVFERFKQADSTSTRRIGGLGLGLAIVRHLVELHGGKVRAYSEGKDRGATFTVTLPVADAGSGTTPAVPNRSTEAFGDAGGTLRALTVLLVEDDRDSRDMLTMALELCGVNMVSVESAAQALDTLPKLRPDFLVSDIGLPEQDGYDLIRKVRKLSADDGGMTPAIALTGYVSVQDRKLAIDAGFHDHLPKPVDTTRLIELLCELAEKTRLEASSPCDEEKGHAN